MEKQKNRTKRGRRKGPSIPIAGFGEYLILGFTYGIVNSHGFRPLAQEGQIALFNLDKEILSGDLALINTGKK